MLLYEINILDNGLVKGNSAVQLFKLLKSIDNGACSFENVAEFSDIRIIDFSEMGLEELPHAIGLFSNLEELYLQINNLMELPPEIGELKKLKKLDVHNNILSVLPDELCFLDKLLEFNADWNQLKKLPNDFGNLGNIEVISLIGNLLRTLPTSFGKLHKLSVLDVQSNQIVSLPESMSELVSLETLDLSENHLYEFPECVCRLKSLKRLGFCKMKVHHFPKAILNLNLQFKNNTIFDVTNPEGIYLYGTSLATQPISLFFQNRGLIESFYASPKDTLQEAKVIFLGDGNVGKTYTIKRLMYEGRLETKENSSEYLTTETHGIIISKYASLHGSKNIHFWDFGGQDILYSMHRCFLTERSCYVVMVSTRTPNPMERARYWLRCISNFAPNSPIVLVVNRFSNLGCSGLDEARLQCEFPQLQRIKYLSVKYASTEEFMLLDKDISDVVNQLDGTGMEFPRSWNLVRKKILEEAVENQKFYITEQEYFDICANCGVLKENSVTEQGDLRLWLLDWFNDLGDCFSNHKNKKTDFAILNPEWLTNALYLIIFNGKTYTDTGVLPHKLINMILKHPEEGESGCVPYLSDVVYGEKECKYILEIMREYRLSYAESDKTEFIPVLASEKRPPDSELIPKGWDSEDARCSKLTYRLKYVYLPEVVLHRLMIICRKELKLLLSPWWRSGMRIDSIAFDLSVVLEMKDNDEIEIQVYSYGMEPIWKILHPIKQIIVEISEYLNLKFEDYIEIQGENQKDVFRVEWLIKQRNKGKREVYGEDNDYQIDDLLGAAYGEDNLRMAMEEAKKNNIPFNLSGINQTMGNNGVINNYFINTTNYSNGSVKVNIGDYIRNGFSQDELVRYLELLPDREFQVPEQFLIQLSDMLKIQSESISENQRDAFMKLSEQLREATSTKKSKLEKLRDWVGDAANVVTVAPAVGTAASILCTYLQQNLPSLVEKFEPMVQLLKLMSINV